MSLEVVFGTVAAAGAGLSAIFGGGILTRYIKHSNELAVTKYILDDTKKKLEAVVADVAELKKDSVEFNTKIDQFTEHIKKLDLIPDLAAQLEATKSLVQSVQSMVSSIHNQTPRLNN